MKFFQCFGPAAIFAAFFMSIATANAFCLGTDPHATLTGKEYNEHPMLVGRVKDGGKLTVYFSKEKRTFSIIVKPPTDPPIWCLIASGDDFRPFLPSQKGSK